MALSRNWSRRRLLAGLTALAPAAQAEMALADLVRNMDSAAAAWKGTRAKVRWERYRSLVDDRSVESGRIAVRRLRSGAVEMLIEFQEPTPYYLSVRGAKVEIYKPRIKTVEQYDAGKSRDKLENALLLGFGTRGSYLGRHYDMRLAGNEPVDGHPAVKVELQPKDSKSELNNSRIDMWISTRLWQPVSQTVYDRATRDYRNYSYSEIELNPDFKSSEFKLPLAPGTKRVRPQR